MKLLVVDDEPVILNGIIRIIHNGNTPFTQVIGAADGVEALEVLDGFRPDLMITDLHMPELSGLDLIKEAQIRALCSRFIILTGYNQFEYARQAMRYRVIDYLLKPVNKDELLDLLLATAESIAESEPRTGMRSKPSGQHTMDKIIAFVEENFRKDLSLDLLAEYVGVHPSYISTLFQKEKGTTFLQYLHSCRIHRAKEILDQFPDCPLEAVAEQVGYANSRHFYKVFKKYENLTPGQYRSSKTL